MPRNKIDPCLFCDEAPCACNKPVKKAAPVRKKVEPSISSDQDSSRQEDPPKKSSSHLAAMKVAAAAAPPKPPPPVKVTVKQVSDEDLLFNDAIRNLGPLLAPEEKEQYAAIITSRPSPAERKAIWKLRRSAADSTE
jgi:hypothetical protein